MTAQDDHPGRPPHYYGRYSRRAEAIRASWARGHDENDVSGREVKPGTLDRRRVKVVFVVGRRSTGTHDDGRTRAAADDSDDDDPHRPHHHRPDTTSHYDPNTSTLTVPADESYDNLVHKLLHFVVWAHENL